MFTLCLSLFKKLFWYSFIIKPTLIASQQNCSPIGSFCRRFLDDVLPFLTVQHVYGVRSGGEEKTPTKTTVLWNFTFPSVVCSSVRAVTNRAVKMVKPQFKGKSSINTSSSSSNPGELTAHWQHRLFTANANFVLVIRFENTRDTYCLSGSLTSFEPYLLTCS